jgi:CRP-like cAMP-binding protein
MPDFIQFCRRITALDEEVSDALSQKLQRTTYKKGDLVLKSGQTCNCFYFIDEGLLKVSFQKDDKEFIMRFFSENSICSQLESFLQQTPSSYRIVALEPTAVTYITHRDLEALCLQYHQVETIFRKFVSVAVINMMKRISEMLEENATERYLHFVKENPDTLQRISLGDLASYLGITQVSLSRIRAK